MNTYRVTIRSHFIRVTTGESAPISYEEPFTQVPARNIFEALANTLTIYQKRIDEIFPEKNYLCTGIFPVVDYEGKLPEKE